MIFKETRAIISNRCGIYLVRVFHVFNKMSRFIKPGFFFKSSNILVSVKQPFLRKKKNKGFFVRSCALNVKNDQSHIKFLHNSVVLLKKRLYIKGSATLGPILFTIKRRKASASFIKKL
jgi:ribosomal protein L14